MGAGYGSLRRSTAVAVTFSRDNGSRLETYVIEGERGSGTICLNGAAARLVQPGDKVIVMSYGEYEPAEIEQYHATVVHVGTDNRVVMVDDNPAGDVPTGARVDAAAN